MALLGNFIWFILLGWWEALLYMALGVLFCITIIGIPIGKALFQYAKLMAFPFGKVIISETELKGKENVAAVRRVGGLIANILWLPFGILCFLLSIASMIVCAITIIGIPVAVVIAKSCKFLLWPVGAKVVTKEEAASLRMRNADPSNVSVSQPIDSGTSLPNHQSLGSPKSIVIQALVAVIVYALSVLFHLIIFQIRNREYVEYSRYVGYDEGYGIYLGLCGWSPQWSLVALLMLGVVIIGTIMKKHLFVVILLCIRLLSYVIYEINYLTRHGYGDVLIIPTIFYIVIIAWYIYIFFIKGGTIQHKTASNTVDSTQSKP